MKKIKRNKIRMRVNREEDAVCRVCGHSRSKSLELFDVAFTDKHIITICDSCNEDLFNKTLKATCAVNAKLKSHRDLAIIQNRRARKNRSM